MKDFHSVVLKKSDSVLKAIQVINDYSPKLAIVCNERRELQGVLTDGDVRRALLDHTPLTESVDRIMCRTPIVVGEGTSRQEMLNIMLERKVRALPVVNAQSQVVGVKTLSQAWAKQKSKAPVFLMAGGFGTRLRPHTHNCPKPLLKVGPRPLLESIIMSFKEYGFEDFYISVHYLAEQVKAYFGDGKRWGVNIAYVEESEPLGTAGALSLLDEPLDSPMIVMNGDLLTKVDFSALLDFHESNQAGATLCVREYSMQVPYGVIESSGSTITKITEKPVSKYFVNAGIYVLSPDIINALPFSKPLNMPDLVTQMLNDKMNVSMFPLHEYWLDIGRLADFEQAQVDIFEYFN